MQWKRVVRDRVNPGRSETLFAIIGKMCILPNLAWCLTIIIKLEEGEHTPDSVVREYLTTASGSKDYMLFFHSKTIRGLDGFIIKSINYSMFYDGNQGQKDISGRITRDLK
jgi:hypothetical protein